VEAKRCPGSQPLWLYPRHISSTERFTGPQGGHGRTQAGQNEIVVIKWGKTYIYYILLQGGTATGTCGTVSWQIQHMDTR